MLKERDSLDVSHLLTDAQRKHMERREKRVSPDLSHNPPPHAKPALAWEPQSRGSPPLCATPHSCTQKEQIVGKMIAKTYRQRINVTNKFQTISSDLSSTVEPDSPSPPSWRQPTPARVNSSLHVPCLDERVVSSSLLSCMLRHCCMTPGIQHAPGQPVWASRRAQGRWLTLWHAEDEWASVTCRGWEGKCGMQRMRGQVWHVEDEWASVACRGWVGKRGM